MKKQSPTQLPALRRLNAAAMLCCALGAPATLLPAVALAAAKAAPQGADDAAALNFVGADIE